MQPRFGQPAWGREIHAFRIYEGATELQKKIIARQLLKSA
jgi:alkylation response protein AidB-like acyl-CoA dehydrogenase